MPGPVSERHTFTVRAMTYDELAGEQLDAAVAVFGAALGFWRGHPRLQSLGNTIRRQAGYPGFRALGAFHPRGRLVGFTYGYTSQPGLWWREQIARPLTAEQREFWLTDAFELAELHVHPSAQGRHLGSRLHDGVLSDLPHRTALLSVMHISVIARQLYTSRGWQPLIEDMRFSTEPQTAFSLLGLELPLRRLRPLP